MTSFNPMSAPSLLDPSVDYRWLHEAAPVHHFASYDPPFYTLSRHRDVSEAVRDIATFTSIWGQGPRYSPAIALFSDPPQHSWFRNLLNRALTPAAIASLAPAVEAVVADLLDKVADAPAFDLHDDVAFPLPVSIIARVMGVPDDDLAKFKRWSDSSVESMGAEDPTPWAADLEALRAYLLAQIGARRDNPHAPDDLVTKLVHAERDGEALTDAELLSLTGQLLVGGNETTTSLITNCVWRLLETPSLWRQLVADPGLVDAAIEESLRFDPPVLGLYRTTTRDVEMHGVTIPANTKVLMHYAAANRDASVFPDPDSFRLDRDNAGRHLAFGFGIHFCVGRELARLEARLALKALVARMPDLALESAGERIRPWFLWGRKRLPVRRVLS